MLSESFQCTINVALMVCKFSTVVLREVIPLGRLVLVTEHSTRLSVSPELAAGIVRAFTGKPAFEAAILAELIRQLESSTPRSPSQLVQDLDPLAERVILRCLEAQPDRRPQTALQVAAALPGGDPLVAALAAGETPSPEIMAASGGKGALQPKTAWSISRFLNGLELVPGGGVEPP